LHRQWPALVPERAGDFAQALMDLGSAICTPKRPACPNCPLNEYCPGAQTRHPGNAAGQGAQDGAATQTRRGFRGRDRTGAVLWSKRPDKGLLASMLEPPLRPWTEEFPSTTKGLKTGAV